LITAGTSPVTTVDLLRHGRCKGGEIYRGRTDVPLHEDGWRQMEAAIADLDAWQRVVTSPLSRCADFARRCAEQLDLPLQVEPALQEMDFGDWEGRQLQEVWRGDPQLVSRYYDDPGSVTPPGAEPASEARLRVARVWDALLAQCAGEKMLLISHGGVIRLLLSHLLELPLSSIARLHIPYASITRVQVHHRDSGDFPVLLSLNARGYG